MSPDPYYGSYDINNPQSMNRYSYALNMPLSFVDPSGRDCHGTQTITVSPDGTESGSDPSVSCNGGEGGGSDEGYPSAPVTGATPQPPSQPVRTGGGGGFGEHGRSAPNCSQQDVCAASALLHNGLNTTLDLLGAIPILGSWSEGTKTAIDGVQLAGALGSAGIAMFAPADLGGNSESATGSGVGLGLAAAARTFGPTQIRGLTSVSEISEPALRVFGDAVGVIPLVGNLFSLGMAVNDIHEMGDYYDDCLAGKN